MSDRLADELEASLLEAEVWMRRQDRLAGLVPPDAHRALFAHEIAARTNFAGIEQEVDAAGAQILGRLIADRRQFLQLLEQNLRNAGETAAEITAAAAVAERLLAIDGPDGLASIEGVRALLDDAERWHLQRLTEAAIAGGVRAQDEAAAQNVPIGDAPVDLSVIDADRQLGVTARRLAGAPHADAVRALRDTSAGMSVVDLDAPAFVDALMKAARQLSPAPLDTVARNAAQSADGLGRQAAVDRLPQPKSIYASELLDENTCGPCSLVDGTEYPDLETAQKDYPTGTYRRCEGGARCRGTLVFVWGTESPAST